MRMGSRGDAGLEEGEDWQGFLLHALGIDQPHIAHDRCSQPIFHRSHATHSLQCWARKEKNPTRHPMEPESATYGATNNQIVDSGVKTYDRGRSFDPHSPREKTLHNNGLSSVLYMFHYWKLLLHCYYIIKKYDLNYKRRDQNIKTNTD